MPGFAETAFRRALLLELVLAALTYLALRRVTAPYGRHARPGWGPVLAARLGWTLMELPALLGFLAVFVAGSQRGELMPLLLAALWTLHYAQRSLVFPWRLPPTARPLPVLVVALGLLFNTLNAPINAYWLAEVARYHARWLLDPRLIFGVVLFFGGLAINWHADAALLRLRRAGGYRIPQGGLFRWVSCPNYLGEIVEWWGWALAAWSPAGAVFALYTMANLLPRALAHHRWYRARFADYPRQRRALLPLIW
ncbi:MAG: DUF1295 domain-containing protein [Proteobacteria bacterium]|nr:DUF1295 domain-containing protein [Pseudomonadota bacterium]